ncbi:NADPH-dependent FMN reductase [Alicyclobacillus sp. SO9]|uniref:NADPH-dependent FMN reductase n=1 Tax=Alicyclobacillus sp. SO9 TaxID=2665646 RepID=UPI0018E7A5EA|nr:NADPH-dependent FMN reductase [Alicyclobacillus sp. SO9]QQE77701.1 NAD(P)H-dependent oxidoreductase [Alicyclobacillus sp. SO9]
MNVICMVGSLRKDSYNMQFAKTLQERYTDKFHLDILDIGQLPYYNEDIEQNPGEVVQSFKQQVAAADAVIFVTPEYNWSIPGVLKNALDWLSRVDKVMNGKPVLTAGVSAGFLATIRAQLHLREILASAGLNVKMFPPGGNEILVGAAKDKFENGRLSDAGTLTFIDSVMEKFVQFVLSAK